MKGNPIIKKLRANLERAKIPAEKMKFGKAGTRLVIFQPLELCLIFPDLETVMAYRLYRNQRVPPDAVKPTFHHEGSLETLGFQLWRFGLINETAAVLYFGVDRGPGKVIPLPGRSLAAAA